MLNAICRKPIDLDLSHSVDRVRGLYGDNSRVAGSQEPVHVHVRIRQYGDSLPGIPQTRTERPDFGRLPVGSNLDCYV